MEQITINFEPGLRTLYPTVMDVLRAMAARAVAGGKQMKSIAADMDMSASELSRRLNADINENDTRVFDVALLDAFMRATGSTLVIDWLVEGHMADQHAMEDRVRQVAVRELARMVPEIQRLMAAAGAGAS